MGRGHINLCLLLLWSDFVNFHVTTVCLNNWFLYSAVNFEKYKSNVGRVGIIYNAELCFYPGASQEYACFLHAVQKNIAYYSVKKKKKLMNHQSCSMYHTSAFLRESFFEREFISLICSISEKQMPPLLHLFSQCKTCGHTEQSKDD